MKTAHVFERQGTLYIRTYSKTTLGSWRAMGAPGVLPTECTSAAIGEAVRRHLASSTVGVEFISRGMVTPPDELLQAARVRSWRAFGKLAKLVMVDEESGQLTITPPEEYWQRVYAA